MSSLTRARSLRKPAGPTALPPKERLKDGVGSQDPNRNISPSRLPTKPAMRPKTSSASSTTTMTTTTTASSAAAAAGGPRSTSGRVNRPGSASSNASSSAPPPRRSVSLGKKPATTAQEQHTAKGPPARKEAHRYPPLSSATRPSSMVVMRPTSAGSTTTSTATRRTTPTHARANSAAVTGTGTSRAAPPAATQERKSRSRPPSRDATSSVPASAAAPGTPKRRAISADKPPPTTPTAATPRLNRPALSTLQHQRFSPVKTSASSPRPGSTASHSPQRPMSPSKLPANIAASAETSRLQAELLQLHLLHRDAAAVEAHWTSSAKSKLGARFRDVRDAHRALAVREADELEGDNVAALQSWSASGSGGGQLDDKIQALDAAVSGVWAMSEPGGKYARVVRRFERWIERVMDLEEARANGTVGLLVTSGGRTSIGFGSSTRSGGSGGGGGGVEEALFIQDLEQAWTEDCAGMTRKLETWQDQLDGAGELYYNDDDGGGGGEGGGGRSTTSLARMLDGVRSLVEDMLSELGAMEEIRQAALVREEDWIEAMNRDDDENDTPRAGAVWRAM